MAATSDSLYENRVVLMSSFSNHWTATRPRWTSNLTASLCVVGEVTGGCKPRAECVAWPPSSAKFGEQH